MIVNIKTNKSCLKKDEKKHDHALAQLERFPGGKTFQDFRIRKFPIQEAFFTLSTTFQKKKSDNNYHCPPAASPVTPLQSRPFYQPVIFLMQISSKLFFTIFCLHKERKVKFCLSVCCNVISNKHVAL